MKKQQEQSDDEKQDKQSDQTVDQIIEDKYHKGALLYLKSLIGDQTETAQRNVESSPKVGQKRRYSRANIDAIVK